MGFEGHSAGNKSPFDKILEKLDNGEIIRGDKGTHEVTLEDGRILTLHNEDRTVIFTDNNVTTEAIIRDGEITHLELINPHTGLSLRDPTLRIARGDYILKLIADGIITF